MDVNMEQNLARARLVKQMREERAWPQWQLASAALVNLRTIQRLEKDGSASFETLKGVASAFKIDVEQLNPALKSGEVAMPQRIHLMPRLILGKDVADVIDGADQFQVEHDEAQSENSLSFMVSILNQLKADVVRWHDADPVERLKIESELAHAIKEIEGVGYYWFGIKRIIPKIVGEQMSLTMMSTIYMSYSSSRRIVKDTKYMVVPAALTEVVK